MIDTINLFDPQISNFPVNTNKYGQTNYVNLDNAATTPPLKVAEEKVAEYLKGYGSVHRGSGTKSKISTDIYEASRETIKKFLNTPINDYVLFTNNTTGAVNTLAYFFSFLDGKIAVSEIEHSSSWLPWVKTEGVKALGFKQVDIDSMENINKKIQILGREKIVQYIVNDEFEFNFGAIEQILKTNKIKALIVTASSNLTGYCPDIKHIGQLAHKYGAYFVVDACQYIQHHKMDMQEMGIDFLMASGHKFYAPYGGGFLIGPKKFFDTFLPYQIGGGNLPYITESGEFIRYQTQMAHDPGTPNAIGAISMSVALEELNKIGIEEIFKYEYNLTKKVFDYLKSNPKIELYVKEKHLNTVIPFNIKDMKAKTVAEKLNSDHGIGVRAGSFCVYGAIRKLLKVSNDKHIADSVRNGDTSQIPQLVRASFGLCNTEADADRFIEAIKDLTK